MNAEAYLPKLQRKEARQGLDMLPKEEGRIQQAESFDQSRQFPQSPEDQRKHDHTEDIKYCLHIVN